MIQVCRVLCIWRLYYFKSMYVGETYRLIEFDILCKHSIHLKPRLSLSSKRLYFSFVCLISFVVSFGPPDFQLFSKLNRVVNRCQDVINGIFLF